MDILSVSIGLGLVVSLFFSEFFGIAGGLVVPGYFALQLQNPLAIGFTLGIAFITLTLGKLISKFTILYGKRRTAILLLLGFLLDSGFNIWVLGWILPPNMGEVSGEIKAIGHIIPGLIALWMDRQGCIETISALLSASILVRLILILFWGGDFFP